MGIFDWFSSGPPSKEKFAKMVAGELRKCGVTSTFDSESYRIILGPSYYFFLDNFYSEYCAAAKSDRPTLLQRIVQQMSEPSDEVPQDFEEAKPNLRPRIWMRGMAAQIRLRSAIEQGDSKVSLHEYPVGSHMIATVVYDLPTAIHTIPVDQYEKWGTTYYEAFEIATENLGQIGFKCTQLGEGLYVCDNSDSYDASRLLLSEFVESLQVKGDLVALAPNRDLLLITGTEDDQGLAIMYDVAEKALEDPRPMAAVAVRLVGDDWVDWLPSRGHPLFDRFKMLEVKYLVAEFTSQKELLEKLHDVQNVDLHVAKYQGVKSNEGEVFSYCVWSKDVSSLLPKTDKVFFFEEGRNIVAEADWEDVARIVGHLMIEQEDLYPQRFLVKEYPTQEQLGEISR